MKKQISFVFFLFLVFILSGTIPSCTLKKETVAADEYFTCSMDPQVVSKKPGICPICHMDLILVKKNQLGEGQIRLSAQQIKLGNIVSDTVSPELFEREVYLNGELTLDKSALYSITSRVSGRIEKLNIRSAGDKINKGMVLYEVYSEELSLAASAYRVSLPGARAASHKQKLLLLGLTEEQIEQLAREKAIPETFPVFAAKDGFVESVAVKQGESIDQGALICQVGAVHTLWIEATVFPGDLKEIGEGVSIRYSIPAFGPDEKEGIISFMDPEMNSTSRILKARIVIDNPSGELRPGMQAVIFVSTNNHMGLVLPLKAVLYEKDGAYVWIRKPDGIFERRKVRTGMQNSKEIEIEEGLRKGDLVVISGAYLINSELKIKN